MKMGARKTMFFITCSPSFVVIPVERRRRAELVKRETTQEEERISSDASGIQK